ncbi:Uncharacterised protein [Mycobacterium tuberculosis]|nr:Uncharacterised protein [Mycobacterium tuberculosis]
MFYPVPCHDLQSCPAWLGQPGVVIDVGKIGLQKSHGGLASCPAPADEYNLFGLATPGVVLHWPSSVQRGPGAYTGKS